MGERLAAGNVAIALLANTVATGAALVALILTFGPISGAHLNPAVTLVEAWRGGFQWRDVPIYLAAQIAGAFGGGATAHLMFTAPLFLASRNNRSGAAQMFSEFVATFGLVAVIRGCARMRPAHVAYAVGAYITAAYCFTASTSFANTAVTARPLGERHLCRNPSRRRPRLYRRAIGGRLCRPLLFRWLLRPQPNC
jgi:glycerol uptake facilitator-like aquaporin